MSLNASWTQIGSYRGEILSLLYGGQMQNIAEVFEALDHSVSRNSA